jgi:4-hydroxy-3-polyprenylbenzoate decarboxylase
MTAATESGAIIMPPVPAFYFDPRGVAEIVDHTVSRALDLLDIDIPGMPRWGEEEGAV